MKPPGRAGGAEEGRFHLDLIKGSVPGGTGRKEAKIISERTKAPEAKGEKKRNGRSWQKNGSGPENSCWG